MPPTIIATPADPAANSYLTVAEADTYFDSRLPLSPNEWEDADSKEVLLVMATRTLNAFINGVKELTVKDGMKYYRIRPRWTGSPTTATQRLPWPRTGMFDRNENTIDPMVIPQDLKEATAELAGQLGNGDRTLDNDVIVQGIRSLKAGSVALSFSGDAIAQVLPDSVYNLLVPSWITDELYEPAVRAIFDVVSMEDL